MSRLELLFVGLLLATLNNVTPADDCPNGYSKTRDGCEDDDECEGPVCGDNAVCYNTVGSYYCQCEQGYRTEKTHKVNFTQDSGGKCIDIEECREINNICGLNAECTNVPGSYYCTCNLGFVSSTGQDHFNADQHVTCKDVDECLKKASCGLNANCSNTIGSYYCTCNPGFVSSSGQDRFKADQNVTCKDVDECLETVSCGPNSNCINTIGSYYCTCNLGFVSSTGQDRFKADQNVKCKDDDECEDPVCGDNAVCYNTVGSYYCLCEQGYWTEKTHIVNFTLENDGKCVAIRKTSEDKTMCAPDGRCHVTSVYSNNKSSSGHLNSITPTFLSVILWILMFIH